MVLRYISLNDRRNPKEIGKAEIDRFLGVRAIYHHVHATPLEPDAERHSIPLQRSFTVSIGGKSAIIRIESEFEYPVWGIFDFIFEANTTLLSKSSVEIFSKLEYSVRNSSETYFDFSKPFGNGSGR